jgi:hypothetical protein
VLALLLASPAAGTRPNVSLYPARCPQGLVQAPKFKPWSHSIWSLDRWQRGQPSKKVIQHQRVEVKCAAGPGNRKSIRRIWERDQRNYFVWRSKRLWRERVKPFVYPDGTRWAVPFPIAWCESGGNYFVGPSGAYGLIPPFPQYLSPRQQDEIAHRLYVEQGEGPWAPYESGCAYR